MTTDLKKISELPSAAALGNGDQWEVVQVGASKKCTGAQLKTLCATPPLTATSSGGTLVITPITGGYNFDLSLAHPNTFTDKQTITTTSAGHDMSVVIGDAVSGIAGHFTTNISAPGGRADLGTWTSGGVFDFATGATHCVICDSTWAINASVGRIYAQAGLKVDTDVSFFGVAPAGQQADSGAITDSTGGTPSLALTAVVGTGDDATINNNLATLAAAVAAHRATLRAFGLWS